MAKRANQQFQSTKANRKLRKNSPPPFTARVIESLERRFLLAFAPVGPDFQVNTATDGAQSNPAIGVEPNGNFVVAWTNYGADGDRGIHAQMYNASGQRLGNEFLVNTYLNNQQAFASIAVDGAGNFLIAWSSDLQDGSGSGVYAQRYTAAGVPVGAEFRLNTTTEGDQDGVQVSMEDNGDFVAAWQSVHNIFAQRFAADGTKLGNEFQVNPPTAAQLLNPGVKYAPGGRFLVTWETYPGAMGNELFGQFFAADGTRLGAAFKVSTDPQATLLGVIVHFNTNGGFGIIWESNLNGAQDTFEQRYDAAAQPLGSRFKLDESGATFTPHIAPLPNGDYVGTWSSGIEEVLYRIFHADGTPASPELRANSYTPGYQFNPNIGSDSAGDFVIVWESQNQDGSSSGIFGQRYASFDPASVSGQAWVDANGNGIRDSGEGAVSGVEVDLFTSTGAMAGKSVTDDSGKYRFDNLRPGDSYYVQWSTPSGRFFGLQDQGPDDSIDSDVDPATGRSSLFKASAAGEVVANEDAAFLVPASLAGQVWFDSNLDGLFDGDETGRDGATVNLFSESDQLLATTVTSGGGHYQFDGLRPAGKFYLEIVPPIPAPFTTPNVGTDDAIDSDIDPYTHHSALFTLVPGRLNDHFDAGLIISGTISGTAFRDTNGDGILEDGEPAAAGIDLYLDLNDDHQREVYEPTTYTDAVGLFTFRYLGPGTYHVETTDGYIATTPLINRTITLTAGKNVSGIVAGFEPIIPVSETTPVGPERAVNSTTLGQQSYPAVASNDSGAYVSVWAGVRPGLSGLGLYARLYDATGTPRGNEFLLNTSSTQPGPAVGMDGAGNFVVAWLSGNLVMVQRFTANGASRGPELQVNTKSGTHTRAFVAVNAAGAFVVTWSGAVTGDSDSTGVAARLYDANGAARTGELLVNGTANGTDGNQVAAGVSMDATGAFAVGYLSTIIPGAIQGLMGRWFDANGRTIGPAIEVDDVATADEQDASLASDALGNMIFVWRRSVGVYARRYGMDGLARGGDILVTTDASATAPTAAILQEGSFVVAWVSTLGDASKGIAGQLFDPLGVSTGRNFLINTFTNDLQDWPALAAGTGKSFIVMWESFGQDGSNFGIYQQRFEVFGINERVAVDGFIWNDANGDGLQSPGETGIGGIRIDIKTAEGAFVDSTVTTDGGQYSFAALRSSVVYQIQVIAPAGKSFTPKDQGNNDAIDCDVDSSGFSSMFQVPTGGSASLDAGLGISPVITGTIYYDVDASGSRNTGDTVLPGWVVFNDANTNGVLDAGEAFAISDNNGVYRLTGLLLGAYHLRPVLQTDWKTGSPAALDGMLSLGQTVNFDIGYQPTVSVTPRPQTSGSEFQVNSTTNGNQISSSIATDGHGPTVVVWGAGDGVYAQRYDATGAPLGGELLVSSRNAVATSVAMDALGRFFVVWSDGADIYARKFDGNGVALGAEFVVNQTIAGLQAQPDVAMNAKGDVVVVWQSINQDGSGYGIYAKLYPAAATSPGSEFQLNQFTLNDQTKPSVAMDAAGNFVAVWESKHIDGLQKGIFARRFDAGGSAIGTEFSVDFPVSGTQLDAPDIAMNGGGDFVVAYRGFDAGNYGIEARRFNAQGVAQGNSFVVNTTTAGNQDRPAVAMTEDGSFIVSWDDSNEPGTGVRAQWFNGAGLRLGGELQVNTTTADSQIDPAVAAYPGGFVISWSSNNQDGSGYGIYAQRYTTFDPAAVVSSVFVSSSTWKPSYLAALASKGEGDAVFGYKIDPEAATIAVLSWDNLNQISIRFAADVNAAMDLNLTDSGGHSFILNSTGLDSVTRTQSWSLEGLPGGVMPEGALRLKLTSTPVNTPPVTLLDVPVFVLKGDANHDGNVGFADLVPIAQHYGMSDGTFVEGDLNGDGAIDFADLVIIAQNYGKSAIPAAEPVPAPTPAAMPVVISRHAVTAAPPASKAKRGSISASASAPLLLSKSMNQPVRRISPTLPQATSISKFSQKRIVNRMPI